MDLILHIGAAKTGSTTIQEFLRANIDNLKQQGYLLLQSPGGHNNRALAAMCISRDRYSGFYHFNRIDTLENKDAYDKSVIECMTEELSQASEWAHTVISTSEDYYGGLRELDEIERLRDILQPRFRQIKVVLYIRSQVETLSSLYSTFLKNGEVVTLDEFVEERCLPDDNAYNFYRGAEMWSHVFGQNNLSIRLFDPDEFDNGDLLEDFSNQLGEGLFSALTQRIDVQNQSLTTCGQRLALAVNRQIPAFSEKEGWNKRNRALLALISRFYSGRGASLDAQTTALVEEMFSEPNKLLHQKYFSAHKSLFKSSGRQRLRQIR